VVLDVADASALEAAMEQVRSRTGIGRFLVQSMEPGLGEALLGYRVDAHVGPIVMLAAGGILAELHRDRSMRLAPVDLETARAMVTEVRALRALAGFRGRPRGDLEALAAAVVAISGLAVASGVHVLEAELNPLIIRAEGHGVVAVDALVKTA
jgi:hypothetical protein